MDRLTARPSSRQRITDSVETALRLADGVVMLDLVDLAEDDPGRRPCYSEAFTCPNGHPVAVEEIEPRSFSFNSPFGACPACTGLGVQREVDPELIVPDPSLTLAQGPSRRGRAGRSATTSSGCCAGWRRRAASR